MPPLLVLAAALLAAAPAAVAIAGEPPAPDRPRAALVLDFETLPLGPLREPALRALVPALEPAHLARAIVVPDGDGGRALSVEYPRGAIGGRDSGAIFIVRVSPAPEYWLSYRVKLDPAFDFGKGGKLPGLSSGGGRYAGGRIPAEGDGWTARLSFGPAGDLAVYLYHVGMKGPWGDSLRMRASLARGRWHTIVQHVRLDSGERADGILEVWVDGALALARDDVRFRSGALGLIDSLCFSTFHGGATDDWAPRSDVHALFDDLVIAARPPPGLAASSR